MSYTMITPSHNHDTGYISLVSIKLDNVPDTVEVSGYTLVRKNEFHVSLVSLKRLAPLLDTTEDELVQSFLEYEAHHDLVSFQLTHTFRLVRRGDKVTVVVMVAMPAVEGLFDFLRTTYHTDFPTQPTHITLYTLQPETGIGLFSDDEVEKESVPVAIPALSRLSVYTP